MIDGPDSDDATLRPNQLPAVSLPHAPHDDATPVLAAVEPLVTSLGLRSLAPRDPRYVSHPRGGPAERDAAYHQGTVWPWLVGSGSTRWSAPVAPTLACSMVWPRTWPSGAWARCPRVVAEVLQWKTRHPDRWIQMIGNHEAQHFGGPLFSSRTRPASTSPATVKLLQSMASDGQLTAATCIRSAKGDDIVITHAGISATYWRQELGSSICATGVATVLNQMMTRCPKILYRPGALLEGYRSIGGGPAGPDVGPRRPEVYDTWIDERMPFSQIHGHTSPYWFKRRQWQGEISPYVRQHAKVKPKTHHVRFDVGGKRIVGTDAGLGVRPSGSELHPLVLHAGVLEPRAGTAGSQSDGGANRPSWLLS